MNARDNLNPKSIRVAILQALADGAITTIDDLQIKMDEKREKITSNVYPAATEGLIKRLRDDVTGAAAYQITAKGRDLLAKYSSGKADAPADVADAVAVEKSVITPGVKVENDAKESALLIKELRAIAKDREDRIEVLDGELTRAIAEKDAEIAELADKYAAAVESINEFRCIADELRGWRYVANLFGLTTAADVEERIRELCIYVDSHPEHNTTPVGYVIQRPAKPLVRFTKAENAQARAISFTRSSGKRAQVFALIPVGDALPGAEWWSA